MELYTYEDLLNECEIKGAKVVERNLGTEKPCGFCYENLIAVNSRMNSIEKKCVLVEELGHFCTTTGNIVCLDSIRNRKQEEIARRWGYRKLIPISELLRVSKLGLKFDYEVAEELGVTVQFLKSCIEYYKCRYETSKFLEEERNGI